MLDTNEIHCINIELLGSTINLVPTSSQLRVSAFDTVFCRDGIDLCCLEARLALLVISIT